MFKKLLSNNVFSGTVFFTGSALYFYNLNNSKKYEEINWLKIRNLVENDEIDKVELYNDRKAFVYPIKDDNKVYHMNISNNNFVEKKFDKFNKDIVIEHKNQSIITSLIFASIPTLFLMGGLFYFFRKQTNKSFSFFKNEFKIIEEKTGIKIDDVAGLHQTKKDVLEFADIVMNSEKYQAIGTKIPTGILMEGPPGTGKTMLAKAVADSYNTKFFLMNGSDFIQPIIGTGSKKVKELFDTARKNSPSIIFIDEIDAIGKSRNMNKSIGNDERDNILNSLLVEMDGFNVNEKVLIMGATNRSDVLDQALLRPGRFDRIVNFELPNIDERKDILNMYYDKYKISKEIIRDDLIRYLSNLTFSFNGAQLQNIFNEASIRAIRSNRDSINKRDFDESIEYVLLGNKKEGVLSEKEKDIVSCHEAGHAVISFLLENVASPSKVSIIPRTKGALGFSQSIPSYEKKLYSYNELIEQIMVLMGGRVAEEIIFNDVTTGASDDINKLNEIARNIVGTYGMTYNLNMNKFDLDTKNNFWRKESEGKMTDFDNEVDKIINMCYEKTKEILNDNILFLKTIQGKLLDEETIISDDIENIYMTIKK